VTTATADAAVTLARARAPQIVILLAASAEATKELECLRQLRSEQPRARFVFIAQASSENLAIDALHAGAERYLRGPVDAAVLQRTVEALRDPDIVGGSASALVGGERFIGTSQASDALRTQLKRVAGCASNVLISGETGTGKELVAELIHANGPRASKPLVCLNTTAIPDALVESELFGHERGSFTGATMTQRGKLSAANGGTAFLDEIGDVSLAFQAKLLRAIESKTVHPLGSERAVPVDVRFIAATNQDLQKSANEGRFRWDLYYRLNVVRVDVPPLRERIGDIPLLVEHFIGQLNRDLGRSIRGLSQRSMDALRTYHWPGNIRELRNVIEALLVNLAPETAGIVDIPPLVLRQLTAAASSPGSERERILQTLAATNWNKTKAADRLNCSRMTLYRRLHQLDLKTRRD